MGIARVAQPRLDHRVAYLFEDGCAEAAIAMAAISAKAEASRRAVAVHVTSGYQKRIALDRRVPPSLNYI